MQKPLRVSQCDLENAEISFCYPKIRRIARYLTSFWQKKGSFCFYR